MPRKNDPHKLQNLTGPLKLAISVQQSNKS